MNTKAITLALLIAGFAMYMVWQYIEDQKNVIIKKFGKPSTVVIAKNDIHELDLIDDSKIVTTTVPSRFAAPGSFKTVKELQNLIALTPIKKGEQITKTRVDYPGFRTGLSRQVSIGKRAIAILVSDRQAVGKLIKPGDRVDIIAKIDYAGGKKDRVKMKTILQDVLILSTGFDITNSIPLIGVKGAAAEIKKMKLNTFSRYNTVTLELDPFQAQKLSYVIRNIDPEPYLALRNNNDQKRLRIPATKIFDVLGDDAAEARSYFNEKNKKK